MCFCFDGQGAMKPHRPDSCRERGRGAGAPEVSLSTARGEPDCLEAARAAEPAEAVQIGN
ncbi:hypothetical protein C8D77_106158 [Mesorhizobium loti]|uniref:Uncharacterized protein n=1 Tax=Rhizobium loti TaxID=381 RepID=A0A8E2WA52_RHILI|nr:hypothetical protein C8D77_106158 [Mesorhizobium loti]